MATPASTYSSTTPASQIIATEKRATSTPTGSVPTKADAAPWHLPASDLSRYREDGTTAWYEEEVKRVGEKRLLAMYNYLYRLAASLRVDDCIHILKICSNPQDQRIAVKACCEIEDTYRLGWRNRIERLRGRKKTVTLRDEMRVMGTQFYMNKEYNTLRRTS